MILAIITFLFCEDLLPTIPMLAMGYMSVSRDNNPFSYHGDTIFQNKSFLIQLIIILVICFLFLLARALFIFIRNKKEKHFPRLAIGYGVLTLVLAIGGLFSGFYEIKTFTYGILVGLSLSIGYFIYYYTVKWETINKEYILILLTTIGVMMSIEILNINIIAGAFTTESGFVRGNIYTGWGNYNNIGCMTAMALTGPFALAIIKKEKGWIFNIIGHINLGFLCLSQSRNSILFGLILYLGLIIIMFIYTKSKARINNIITLSSIYVLIGIGLIILREDVAKVFASLKNVGFDDSNRFDIYIESLTSFKSTPILGKGFYQNNIFQWGSSDRITFIPPRYHNTYIQMLCTSGIIGLIGYVYHRYQTISIIFDKVNITKILYGFAALSLPLLSLLDCHFFNIGPGLLYGICLVFIEKEEELSII
ncbi:MAG: O-antigen ligase family protein [Bacilli bacterium]